MSTTCTSPARARTTGRSRVSSNGRERFPLRPNRHGRDAASRKLFVRIGDRPGSGSPGIPGEPGKFDDPASRGLRVSAAWSAWPREKRSLTGSPPASRKHFVRIGPVMDSRPFRRSRENSMIQNLGVSASPQHGAPGRASGGHCPDRRPRAASSSSESETGPVRDRRAFRRCRENSMNQHVGASASRRHRAPGLMRTGSYPARRPLTGQMARSPSSRVAARASSQTRFRRSTRTTSSWASRGLATEVGS